METDGVVVPSSGLTSSLSPSILTPPAHPTQGLFLCTCVPRRMGPSVVWAWFQLSRGLKLLLPVLTTALSSGYRGKSLVFLLRAKKASLLSCLFFYFADTNDCSPHPW